MILAGSVLRLGPGYFGPSQLVPACLVLAGAIGLAAAARAQPPAPAADLPPALQGTAIGQALQAGRWAEAETLLVAAIERAPQASPQSAPLLAVLGRVFLAQRKALNAAIAIKKAEAIAPIDQATRFTLALAYLALRRGDWARPELERLAAADAASPLYEYWLGRIDYDAGQFAAAVRRFERVVTRDARFVRAYDNLGLAYEGVNDLDRAVAAYRRGLALNRDAAGKSPWPPLNLGILLQALGETTEAEALYREAIGYDATLAPAHYRLGVLLEDSGRADEAIASLDRAVAADAAYAEPHYALARLYRRRGRDKEAQAAIVTFERLHEAQRNGTER